MTYPNPPQFKEAVPELPKKLPKGIRNSYRELSQQIDFQLKLKKLEEKTCYPWQLRCDKGVQKA